jgi:PPOX class probable F420-dependent enzyme
MRLEPAQAWRRLGEARHGVLGTLHPERGPDLVPVVFALDGDRLFVPVDRVKAKRTTRLRRLANIEHDPRCSLLVEHWSEDWSELWWVRASGTGRVLQGAGPWQRLLADRHPQYRDPDMLDGGIEIAVDSIAGWSAGDPQASSGK